MIAKLMLDEQFTHSRLFMDEDYFHICKTMIENEILENDKNKLSVNAITD